MSRIRRTPPKIMVFHRQTSNDADWKIGTWVEDNAADIDNKLSTDPKATIGTWLVWSQVTGWDYAGHSLHPRHEDHKPNDYIAIYYFAWEGRNGFDIDRPLLKPEEAQWMGLSKRTLIRLVNDTEFSRFVRVENVIKHFAWEDVHEVAQTQLKAEIWTRRYDRCFEGEFPYVTLKSRMELMRIAEVMIKVEDGIEIMEEVKIKIEGHSEIEEAIHSFEAVASSAIKSEPGLVSVSALKFALAGARAEHCARKQSQQ